MKKILSLLISAVMAMSVLTSCGKDSNDSSNLDSSNISNSIDSSNNSILDSSIIDISDIGDSIDSDSNSNSNSKNSSKDIDSSESVDSKESTDSTDSNNNSSNSSNTSSGANTKSNTNTSTNANANSNSKNTNNNTNSNTGTNNNSNTSNNNSGSNSNSNTGNSNNNNTNTNTNNKGMRNMTTAQIVDEMGIGINLGNTFESCGSWINNSSVTNYEIGWGSPKITQTLIKGYANAGFGVLRIPVAWSNMMGNNYTINKDYMARVKQVCDWAIDSGMYVIVNVHWDSGWWEEFPTNKTECMKKYTRIWEQVSAAFKDYGDYVMFESLNEEGGWDSVWNRYSGSTNGKATSYGLLNEINQKFVDIVRGSGGNNSKRHLLIAGYVTDISLTCDKLFVMPKDSQKRCAVSVHYYTPSTFCILEKDESWGKARYDWGTQSDINELKKYMNLMKTNFVDKGIPVIIGEYGCPIKNKDPESVRLFLTSVCREAYSRGMCPVLWDTTNTFYNRNTYKMIDSQLEKAFKNIAK